MKLETTTMDRPIVAPKRGVNLEHRNLSWFAQRVERGRNEIFSEIVTITPEIAKRLLEQNNDNRKMKERVIKAIAQDIKNGHWKLNGESLIVTCDGELNDGQNRLMAIVRAGLPVPSLVVFGVTRDSRLTVDMGAARSVAEFLSMTGNMNAIRFASMARLHLSFLESNGKSYNKGTMATRQDVIEQFEENKDEFIVAYRETGSLKFSYSVSGRAFIPVAYMNIHRIDSINCGLFFEKLASGADLAATDPILWLRQKLYEIINTKQSLRSEQKLEYVLRYWNAWASGAKMKSHIKLTGTYPKIKPATDRTSKQDEDQ